jgi:8-oxo-dGTP pyrophosphatase MutT (NUDIX family)
MKITNPKPDVKRLRGIRHVVFGWSGTLCDGRGMLFSGVKETLTELARSGVTASVFSTMRQELLERACRKLRVAKSFKAVQGSVSDKAASFPGHLRRVGAVPKNTLFIGCEARDVEAANARGVISGCVTDGKSPEGRLISAGPRFVWTSQRDWSPFFRELFRRLPPKEAKPYPVATAGALVVNPKGYVLLVLTHKWGFTYGIPGGKIEKGESARAAVIRELLEETGLDVKPGNLFLCMDCIDSPEFHVSGAHFLLLNYVAKTRSTRVNLNEEAVSFLWIDPRQALKLRLNAPTRALIEASLKTLSSEE